MPVVGSEPLEAWCRSIDMQGASTKRLEGAKGLFASARLLADKILVAFVLLLLPEFLVLTLSHEPHGLPILQDRQE